MLYFIKSEDTQKDQSDRIIIKIGISKNPTFRLKELQTGNHNKLTLIKTIQCDDYRKLETMMHRIYQQNNKHGEWFEFSIEEFYACIDKAENLAKEINNNIKTNTANTTNTTNTTNTINAINTINKNNVINNLSNTNTQTQTITTNKNYCGFNNQFDNLTNLINLTNPINLTNSTNPTNSNKLDQMYYNIKLNYFETNLFAFVVRGYENDCIEISKSEKNNFVNYLTDNNKFLTVKVNNVENNKFVYAMVKDFCNYGNTMMISDKTSEKIDLKTNQKVKITMCSLVEITTIVTTSLMTDNIANDIIDINNVSKENFCKAIKNRNILYVGEIVDTFIIDDIYSNDKRIEAGIISIEPFNIVCTFVH